MRPTPRVFTIPPTAPFLRTLADAVLDGRVVPGFAPRHAPETLSDATIFLPTRRAAGELADAFLESLGTNAALLPRIVPLGDVDEDALAFDFDGLEPLAPAVSSAQRRLALANLISRFAESQPGLLPGSPAAAIALADELAHLIDDFITAGLPFDALKEAVDGEYDKYWERSRLFLRLAGDGWNNFLSENGMMDAAARRAALLAHESARLAGGGGGPVIAAGSTGTLPKVAELLRTVALRANGAVVLPGLDQIIDDDAFAAIGAEDEPLPGHPQFGLKRLIKKIGIARSAVEPLGVPVAPLREQLLSRAFRPPVSADNFPALSPDVLRGITVIEASDAREEALAIAIVLRETLALSGKTAALVTPDRALARRVCAELAYWDIEAYDSAGVPLAETEAGRFARLVAEAALEDTAPSTLLALLRHPAMDERFQEPHIDALEIAVLRGGRPAGGVRGLQAAIAGSKAQDIHRFDARSRLLTEEDWANAAALAKELADALAPLTALHGTRDFAPVATAHREAITKIAPRFFDEGEDAEALLALFDELIAAGSASAPMTLAEYADALPALLRDRTVRTAARGDARIRILGPLESRMIAVDRMVLGGLCEGVWPPEAHSDAWLNRPMRRKLKLDLPERRIGLSAHDFVQAAGGAEVFLTRARKQNGVETIASRFVQRLAAAAPLVDKKKSWDETLQRGERYLLLARSLSPQEKAAPASAPRPKPPVSARPVFFSASDVRDLVRDPYTIYAKYILGLHAIDPVDDEPEAAQRGTLIHVILEKFTKEYPSALPDDALARLVAIGDAEFKTQETNPAARAVWWPRFLRAAEWFVAWEKERRAEISAIHTEQRGELKFPIGAREFTLSARADRIDLRAGNLASVLDYKTGKPPSIKEMIAGFEPQLPLEAAIVAGGGFKNVGERNVAELGIVRLSGNKEPGDFADFARKIEKDFADIAQRLRIALREGQQPVDAVAEAALRDFKKLLAEYESEDTAYLSTPRPQWRNEYGKYDHLARIKEWSEDPDE